MLGITVKGQRFPSSSGIAWYVTSPEQSFSSAPDSEILTIPTRLMSPHAPNGTESPGLTGGSDGWNPPERSAAGPARFAQPTLAKYRLLARLGRGGMAEVYLAVAGGPGGFSKLQVLKVLKPDLSDQERTDFAQMFQDEGRLAARLNHPNIVQSHEVGSQDGYDFIAMEYLEGQPLSRVQERSWPVDGAFPLEIQLHVLSQVLEGLEYAHTLTDYDGTELNIVHRDISPQNVFITYAGHTKLVDFGIAKTLESRKTRAGVVKGKVPYMSPEQVLAGNVDRRADLFSVGVMLWEAIARRSMHGAATVYEILQRLVHGNLPKIRDVVPDVSPELERIVTRALALKPEDRYPDAAAFREELGDVIDGYRKIRGREVGERVSALFVDERRDISAVIRRAMTEMRERGSEPGDLASVHLLPTLRVLAASSSHAMTNEGHAVAASELVPVGPTTSTRTAPTTVPMGQVSTTPPVDIARVQSAVPVARSGRPRWILVAAAAGLGAVAAALIFAERRAGERSAAGDTTILSAAGPDASPAPVSSVRIRIRAFPDQAALVLDGRPLEQNPYDAQHARDALEHTLNVSAPGFRSRTLPVLFSRDVDLEVRLAETDAPTVTPRKSAASAPPTPAPTARLQSGPRTNSAPRNAPSKSGDSGDPYGEFPKSKARPGTAPPPLDTSEPW